MREIDVGKIGQTLLELINEKDPVDEDIGIISDKGIILGVIISNSAYNFFLEKIEEAEDRIDKQTVAEFHKYGERNEE